MHGRFSSPPSGSWLCRWHGRSTRRCHATGPARESLKRHGGIIVASDRAGGDRPGKPRGRRASGVRYRSVRRRREIGRSDFCGPVHGAGRRRLRDRLQSRAADERRRAVSRRPAHGRLRARVDVQRMTRAGLDASGARSSRHWRARRDSTRTPGLSRCGGDDLPSTGRS